MKLDLGPRRLRRDLEELWEGFFGLAPWMSLPESFDRSLAPPVNVAETEKAWIFTFELPGLEEQDITVRLLGNQLVVGAERRFEDERKGKDFHRVESRYGSYRRTVAVPETARLDPGTVKATYRKGILEVVLPKSEPGRAARIPVRSS